MLQKFFFRQNTVIFIYWIRLDLSIITHTITDDWLLLNSIAGTMETLIELKVNS
jgi:hypothetical protein